MKSEARIDLHCHSRYSTSASPWLVTQLGLEASRTDPETIYGLAKLRGMTHVTITDNNTIEGALRLAHHEDFIIGEQVKATFAGEAVGVDVLVWGISEEQHRDIVSELRFDVLALVDYLRAEHIAYGLAHPCSLITKGMTDEHLEELIARFEIWETRNGLSSRRENEALAALVAGSGMLGSCAGSDDHAGFDVGTTFTSILMNDGEDVLTALMDGRGEAHGDDVSTAKLAHNGVAVTLRPGGEQSSPLSWFLGKTASAPLTWRLLAAPSRRRLASRAVAASTRLARGRSARKKPLDFVVQTVVEELLSTDALGAGIPHELLRQRVDGLWRDTLRSLRDADGEFDLVGILRDRERRNELAKAQSLIAPYLLASGVHARQRRRGGAVADRLTALGYLGTSPAACDLPRIALFTDTFTEVNGVGTVLQALRAHAVANDWPLTIVTAGPSRVSEPSLEVFPAVMSGAMSVYPGFPMALLPVPAVLDWCEEQEVEMIHVATPGLVGLAAWSLASSLDMPLVGTYHTDLPSLGYALTGDHLVDEGLWAYVRLFYDQCDVVLCPSERTRADLEEHRLKSKLDRFRQGVDCDLFAPEHRDEVYRQELGGGKRILLWVGRLSPEKGLDTLAVVYDAMQERRQDVRLVVVGEGPRSTELRRRLPQAAFLGVLRGDALARAFASADVFLFPGHSETFGQTVLEAAASGLPAVVTAGSGTEDAMIRGVTAFSVAPGDTHGFVQAIERLLDEDDARAEVAAAARRFALDHSWPATWERLADIYRSLPR